ncbi:MAG TPA: glycosyltransferase [Flavilitoribacter sp.]|nr:glycosyltransferase [Flavilitoribacter sp.]HMQ89929.1 glycosyltransferase [Flavilitoribacter sp.]
MKDRLTILFYCHHSIGIGHLVRSMALITAIQDVFRVVFISGGRFPQGFDLSKNIVFIQIPPLERGEGRNLVTTESEKTIKEVIKARVNAMLEAVDEFQPDFFITELFPFGRVQLCGELIPVLRRLRSGKKPVKILSSLRDIVEPGLHRNLMERNLAISLAGQFFDGVLIHADPQLIRLEASFPTASKLKPDLHYTGFVTRAQPVKWQCENPTVLVSAGGGKKGLQLCETAIKAFLKFGFGEGIRLRVIAGPNFSNDHWLKLHRTIRGRKDIELTRSVRNLSMEFRGVALSVSQGGYNTTMELLQCGVPALIIPFTDPGNTEQILRAKILSERELVRYIDMEGLSPDSFATEVRKTIHFRPAIHHLDMQGAENTLRILQKLSP